jgi:hypothetical protein
MLRTSRIEGGRPATAGKLSAEGGDSALTLPPSPFRPRTAITLIEVLISMFVLLFGLMGVAAIFPVASHYVLEGDKRDRSSGLAQIAFEELKSRKLLKPTQWINPATSSFGYPFIQMGLFVNQNCAFVIDPLGSTQEVLPPLSDDKQYFPHSAPTQNPTEWRSSMKGIGGNPPTFEWPIRRLTLDRDSDVTNGNFMSAQTAETAFRLRDDLVTQQPEAGDRPSVQRWRQNGGQMLSREYIGDYSWLATVVPTRNTALMGLQPSANIRDEFYEVTSVVFYKRDITPSATTGGSAGSERLIGAEFLNSGELALYDDNTTTGSPETVDTALDGIKPTNWIAVCGVNQITGAFMMKWYKILAMDDSTSLDNLPGAGSKDVRYLMVDGPEWPEGKNSAGAALGWRNLRAVILPGAIDAYTRVMQIEQE